MSVYQPDMRVMFKTLSGRYYSHAEYNTQKGAQALADKLRARKPKVAYAVTITSTGTFRVTVV